MTLLKAADEKVTRGSYNLQQVHSSVPRPPASGTVPWIPVDPGVVLPFHQRHGRIPCSFPVTHGLKVTALKTESAIRKTNQGSYSFSISRAAPKSHTDCVHGQIKVNSVDGCFSYTLKQEAGTADSLPAKLASTAAQQVGSVQRHSSNVCQKFHRAETLSSNCKLSR